MPIDPMSVVPVISKQQQRTTAEAVGKDWILLPLEQVPVEGRRPAVDDTRLGYKTKICVT